MRFHAKRSEREMWVSLKSRSVLERGGGVGWNRSMQADEKYAEYFVALRGASRK